MNPRLSCLAFALTGLAVAAEPSMRERLSAEIKKQVVYSPPAKEAAEALPPTETDVVVLEPFVTKTARDTYAHKIDEQQAKEMAELFSFTEGGVFFKREGKNVTAEVKLRHDPEHDGLTAQHVNWDLLSLSW